MKYMKYLLGLVLLCVLAGFAYFASVDVPVSQTEIRIPVNPEIYSNDS